MMDKTESKKPVTYKSDDESISELIRRRYSAAYNSKLEYSERIRMELAYYLGETWNYLSSRSNRMVRLTDSDIRDLRTKRNVYLINVNKCRPAINVFVSRVTQRKPKLYVHTNSSDEKSKGAARASSEVLDDFRSKDSYLQKDIRNVTWMAVVGKSYKYVHPVLKNKIKKPKPAPVQAEIDALSETEFLSAEQNEPIEPAPELAEGQDLSLFGENEEIALSADVVVDILNAFEVFTPPGIKEIPDMPWIIIVKFVDRREAEERFGRRFGSETGIMNASVEFDENFEMFVGGARGDQKLLIELFEKPSEENPEGAHYAMIDDEVLLKAEFPYWNFSIDKLTGEPKREWGGYRITDYTYTDTLVSHWGQGMIYPVLDLQRKLNMLWSGFYTSRLVTIAPKLLVPKGYKPSKDEFSNSPSIIDRTSFSGEPSQWREPPRGATDTLGLIEALERKFDEMTGIHQISMGQEPLQRLPFLAIRFIQDMDMDKFRPFFDNYEEQEAKHGKDIINSLKQYNPKYMLTAVDSGDEPDVIELMLDDLNDYDVFVERGSSIPEMLAGKQGMLLELLKYNSFDMSNRMTRMSFIKSINEGWAGELVDREIEALKFAQQENKRMLNPMYIASADGNQIAAPVPVHPQHDHELHIFEHRRPFESSYFWKMPPDVISGINEHIAEHEGYIQQREQAEMEKMIAMQAAQTAAQTAASQPPQNTYQETPVTEASLLGQ